MDTSDSGTGGKAYALDDVAAGGLSVLETAQVRWLSVEEIIDLLTPGDSSKYGHHAQAQAGHGPTYKLELSPSPPSSPPRSGTLLLYDRTAVRNYKADGHEWIKKRNNPNKVREDHVKLRFQGQYRVSGTYVHSAAVSTLHRRAYRLIDVPGVNMAGGGGGGGIGEFTTGGSAESEVVLVHYLDTLEAVRVSALYADHLAAAASKNRRGKKKSAKSASAKSASAKSAASSHAAAAAAYSASAARTSSSSGGGFYDDNADEDDDADAVHQDHILAAAMSGGGLPQHVRAESDALDENTLDILWDMVVEENMDDGDGDGDDGEDFAGYREDDVQDAAAAAIELHLSAAEKVTLEAQLVNTVEEAIQDVAASTLNEHLTAVSDDDITKAVEQALHETELKPTVEEKIMSKVEDELPDTLKQKLANAIMDELEAETETEMADKDNSEENDNCHDSASDEMEEPQEQPQERPAAGSVSVPDNIPPGNFVPQTPLPEIIDFTPDTAHMGRQTQIVVSTSTPIPVLPPDDPPYRWHVIAAFVDIGKNADFVPAAQVSGSGSDSTSATQSPSPPPLSPNQSPQQQSPPFSPDPLIMKVALTYVRKLTPYSYKCFIPEDISYAGQRSVILVGVRYIDADAGPLWDAIRVAVKVCIQAEWNVASDLNAGAGKTRMGDNQNNALVRPKFYAPAGSGNVQLLTQLSQDLFEFQAVPAVSMVPALPAAAASASAQGKDKNSRSRASGNRDNSSPMSTGDLPAPSATLATVASALTQFPDNPPIKALGAKIPVTAARHKRALSIDQNIAQGQVQAANASAEDWANSIVPDSDGVTQAEVVDRHCKIRFVERLANVIVGTEDASKKSSMGGDQFGFPGAGAGTGTGTGDIATEGYKDPGILLKGDQKLTNINDEELDSLLHSVLIRFVEAIVDSSTSEAELKAALNAPGFSGFALLHYAALYNILSLIPLLLSRGADPNVTTLKGQLTPLHLASGAGHDQIVDALVRAGAMIDAQDSFGLTPAVHAKRNGFIEIAEWLVDKHRGVADSTVPVCSVKGSWTLDAGEKSQMMQSAFKELSLKDKLGLNLFVQKYRREAESDLDDEVVMSEDADEGGNAAASDVGDDDVDFAFISEQDRESLKTAMSLMSAEELEELERNAPYSNVRDWMLRSNYESLRDASIQLEKQAKKKIIPGGGNESSSSQQSRSSDGEKKFNHSKLSKVLAMLVLRKNLLGTSQEQGGQAMGTSGT